MALVLLQLFRRLSVQGEDFKVEFDNDNRLLDCRLPTLESGSCQVYAI